MLWSSSWLEMIAAAVGAEERVVVEVQAHLPGPARIAPQDPARGVDEEDAVVAAVGDQEVAGKRAAEARRQPARPAPALRRARGSGIGRRAAAAAARCSGSTRPARCRRFRRPPASRSGSVDHPGVRERLRQPRRHPGAAVGGHGDNVRPSTPAGPIPPTTYIVSPSTPGRGVHDRLRQACRSGSPGRGRGRTGRRPPRARPVVRPPAITMSLAERRDGGVAQPHRQPADGARMAAREGDDPVGEDRRRCSRRRCRPSCRSSPPPGRRAASAASRRGGYGRCPGRTGRCPA